MAAPASEIGLRLREIREKQGVTQAAASREMGWAHSVWNQLERGSRVPSTKQLMKIQERWKIDPTWVLTGAGQNQQVEAIPIGTDDYFRLSRQVTALLEQQAQMRKLTAIENRLIDAWRQLEPDRQAALARAFGLLPREVREGGPRYLNEPDAGVTAQRIHGLLQRLHSVPLAEAQRVLDAAEWMLDAQNEARGSEPPVLNEAAAQAGPLVAGNAGERELLERFRAAVPEAQAAALLSLAQLRRPEATAPAAEVRTGTDPAKPET